MKTKNVVDYERTLNLNLPYVNRVWSACPYAYEHRKGTFSCVRRAAAAAATMARREAVKPTVDCSAARGPAQGYCDIEKHCICDDPGLGPNFVKALVSMIVVTIKS